MIGFKHTPGPWCYLYENGYCGEIIADKGRSVCTFVDEPNADDARLIAAAPELLEAAERILDRGYVSASIEEEREDHLMLASAIAKAIGKEK